MNAPFTKLPVFLLLFFSILNQGFSASITWGPANPAGFATTTTVYTNARKVRYEFTNNNAPIMNGRIEIQLGTGMQFVGGSLEYTSSDGATLTENSTTGDNLVIINLSPVSAGEIISFSIKRTANCDARTHKSNGGTFEDVCRIYNGGSEINYSNNFGLPFTANYDVIYGNLVLDNITHNPTSSTTVGGTINRSIEITNGGFGSLKKFWYEESFSENDLELSNFNMNGYLIPANLITQTPGFLRIEFNPTNINLIDGSQNTFGNGNNRFQKDEFFILSYDVTALSCGEDDSHHSSIKLFYGSSIEEECTPSAIETTSISTINGIPNITVSEPLGGFLDMCHDSPFSVTLTNNSTAPEDYARDFMMIIGLFHLDDPIVSNHDTTTLWGTDRYGTRNFKNFTINGYPVTLPQTQGLHDTSVDAILYDYFANDPDGSGGLDDLDGDGFYDDLAAGASITISFEVFLTPIDWECGTGKNNKYFRHEHIMSHVAWLNQCGIPQAPMGFSHHVDNMVRDKNETTTVFGDTDVNDGQTFEVSILPHLSLNKNAILCNQKPALTGTDVNWTVTLHLPPGVSLASSEIVDEHHTGFQPDIYQSGNMVYYTIDRYNEDWYTFQLKMDCSQWDGTSPMELIFQTYYECGTCWKQNIHCIEHYVVPHCPGPCIGMVTKEFYAHRTTAGWTDSEQTNLVELDPEIHNVDHLLTYDTVNITAEGIIKDTISDNLYLEIEYTPEECGNIFEFQKAQITIFDRDGSSGNTEYTFDVPAPVLTHEEDSIFHWAWDLSNILGQIAPGFV